MHIANYSGWNDGMTERQWNNDGYAIKDGESGVMRWTNCHCQRTALYFNDDQIRRMTELEKEKYRAAQLAQRREKDRKRREEKKKAAEAERQRIESAKNEIRRWRDMPLDRIAVIDTETTGLTAGEDECLQVSIIRADGVVLLDTLVKPVRNAEWPEAQWVNGIAPEDVEDAPTFEEITPRIDAALRAVKLVVGYNLPFDTGMLRGCGYKFPTNIEAFQDLMIPFAKIYSEWSNYFGSYKWQKLVTCASYYGFDPEHDAPEGIDYHNSLFDCYATLHCFKNMAERM